MFWDFRHGLLGLRLRPVDGKHTFLETGPSAAEHAGHHDAERPARPRHPRRAPGLRIAPVRGGCAYDGAHTAAGWPVVHRGSVWEARARSDHPDADLGEGSHRCLDRPRRRGRRLRIPARDSRRPSAGNVLSEKVVWQMLRPYAKAAGVAGIAPHDCRRTAAKLCRTAGGELEQIQMLLGHASVRDGNPRIRRQK